MALGAGVGAQLREILAGAWRVARIELHGEVAHVGAEVHLLASHARSWLGGVVRARTTQSKGSRQPTEAMDRV